MLVPLVDADPDRIGGKAAALRRLLLSGFPVPRSWVLPYEALRAALSANRLRGDEPDLAARLLAADLPFSLPAPAIAPLAVRSSAAGEDGAARSHAGQLSSVIGVVGTENLADAVRAVWASGAADTVRAYRESASLPDVAVLVQELIDARVSGVIFTVNPVSGSWREMTVEAVWGLGEGLVGGTVVPDRYVIRRPRRTPRPIQRLLARVRLERTSEVVASQVEERGLAQTGEVVTRPTEAPHARKLVIDELLRLGRLGLRIEGAMGGPQDIEWAIDRGGTPIILQARPITALTRLPRGGAALWTRRFIGERFPTGASPLGWSLLEPLLNWFIDYPETSRSFLGGERALRRVNGHPYLNATVFRHLAFKAPGFPAPRFMLEFFPPDEVLAWTRRAAAPPDLRVYASIFATTFRERRWERFRWNPFANHLAWQQFLAGLDARLIGLAAAPPIAVMDAAEPILRDYIRVHITSLLFANLWWQWTEGFVNDADRDLLFSPAEGSLTTRVNRELRELTPENLPAFLVRHGHRSDASWEVFSTRWIDRPDRVLQLANLARFAPEPPPAGDVETRLASLSPTLRGAVRLTRAYLSLREEQRYHLERILSVLRGGLLALGAPLADPQDIRFLLRNELTLDPADWPAIIARRRLEPVDPSPPDFLRGDEAIPIGPTTQRLDGLGISPGVATGRVRVLRSPDEAGRLRDGEILVTASTDPAWTPLFSRAGGLIVELGSMLSHGAVVAREYRLPAVANVRGATQILTTGMEVTLDGRSGSVWVR
ncbi:phosphoenolpyruvate synthase [Deltaproteobacteria bacterium]|nr:phosphoenolpyruvate synthase [Deltaproteobacteria bacterium]